jgi:hypothetical protein
VESEFLSAAITRSELRKVKSIVTLIGQENLAVLPNTDYHCIKGFHIYVAKNEENDELSLSIWDQPKEKQTSHCLFSDKIRISAFYVAIDYWRPRYYLSGPY